ncbi:hypothetical protein PENSPDRAFT_734251 [Peniophora sp. CONT]|nr:hypothetical protein PENSPDRAFT_734251 [Peniophora sp. CONT]
MATHHSPVSQPTATGTDSSPRKFGELWDAALQDYTDKTGKDILKHPLATAFASCPDHVNEVIDVFEIQTKSFQAFRDKGRKVLQRDAGWRGYIRRYRSPAGDTLVQVFTALALATKYCESTVESDSWLKKVSRALFRRSKDYFRVLVDQTGVQEVFDELDVLTDNEQLATAANTYAIVRDMNVEVQDIHAIVVTD